MSMNPITFSDKCAQYKALLDSEPGKNGLKKPQNMAGVIQYLETQQNDPAFKEQLELVQGLKGITKQVNSPEMKSLKLRINKLISVINDDFLKKCEDYQTKLNNETSRNELKESPDALQNIATYFQQNKDNCQIKNQIGLLRSLHTLSENHPSGVSVHFGAILDNIYPIEALTQKTLKNNRSFVSSLQELESKTSKLEPQVQDKRRRKAVHESVVSLTAQRETLKQEIAAFPTTAPQILKEAKEEVLKVLDKKTHDMKNECGRIKVKIASDFEKTASALYHNNCISDLIALHEVGVKIELNSKLGNLETYIEEKASQEDALTYLKSDKTENPRLETLMQKIAQKYKEGEVKTVVATTVDALLSQFFISDNIQQNSKPNAKDVEILAEKTVIEFTKKYLNKICPEGTSFDEVVKSIDDATLNQINELDENIQKYLKEKI